MWRWIWLFREVDLPLEKEKSLRAMERWAFEGREIYGCLRSTKVMLEEGGTKRREKMNLVEKFFCTHLYIVLGTHFRKDTL